MTLQLSTAARNALLDSIEAAAGASAVLKIRSGAPPAGCAAADSGAVLATFNLPADWMTAASGGAKAKSGAWQDAAADASGTAGHFRLYDAAATTCHLQGTISAAGGGGDLELDGASIVAGQVVTITGFTLTAPGA
jgi:hypothetical protein